MYSKRFEWFRSQHPAFRISDFRFTEIPSLFWKMSLHVKKWSPWTLNLLPVPDAKGEWAPGHVPGWIGIEQRWVTYTYITSVNIINQACVGVSGCLPMDNWVALHSWAAWCICGWTLITGFGTFHPSHLSSTGSMQQYSHPAAGYLAA